MKTNLKTIVLCTMGAFLLVSCNPTNHEKQASEQKEKADTSLMYPEKLDEKAKKDLTSQQQEELEINEDNVMNPFPG